MKKVLVNFLFPNLKDLSFLSKTTLDNPLNVNVRLGSFQGGWDEATIYRGTNYWEASESRGGTGPRAEGAGDLPHAGGGSATHRIVTEYL